METPMESETGPDVSNGDPELRAKLGKLVSLENEENWWRTELFGTNIRSLIPPELEILATPPSEEQNYNCFVHALGLQGHSELLGNNGWEFTRNLGPVVDEMILKGIVEHESTPRAGSLIVYRTSNGTISHIGLMEDEETVISKWSWGPLIRHKIFDVPDHYGDCVEFYSMSNNVLDFVLSKQPTP